MGTRIVRNTQTYNVAFVKLRACSIRDFNSLADLKAFPAVYANKQLNLQFPAPFPCHTVFKCNYVQLAFPPILLYNCSDR